MTPEELKKLIQSGPTDALVAAMAPLTEAERKKLSKGVVAMRKEISRRRTERLGLLLTPTVVCPFCGKMLRTAAAQQCFECGKDWHDGKDDNRAALDFWNREADSRLQLALMGLAPWTEVQRLRTWHVAPHHGNRHRDREHLLQVLSDRKPDWLAKWADRELEEQFLGDWEFVRTLIRRNLCPKPSGEAYILRMLYGIRNHDGKHSLKDQLLADPELLSDEIWRIFELSPVRGTILHAGDITHVPRGDHPSFSWSVTLRALAAEGKLDRQRLLAASLGSLLKNTEARNTAWFSKFHELLEPTLGERHSLLASYLQLLSHPVPGVVGMALSALGVLEKAQKLDVTGFLDVAAAVFQVQPKTQPLAVVKLLGRITARQKGHAAKIAQVLLSGLSHPVPQVQQAIVDLLIQLGNEPADVIASQLPSLLDALAPSVQEQARKLTLTTSQSSGDTREQLGDSELIAEARQTLSPWREQAGIDAVLQALDGTRELAGVALDPMGVPRLDPAQRVQSIQTLDDLIERLTIAVETLDDAIEFELLLDAVSRLCDQRPDDFQARVAPLLHRTESVMFREALPTTAIIGLRSALIQVVRKWCGQDVKKTREDRDAILGFLDVRIGLLLVQVQKRQALPLLACPTHRQGWIEPREMLRRLTWYQRHEAEPNQFDFIQGVLRLAPDGRAETLADTTTRDLQCKFGAAFRYALGGQLGGVALPSAVMCAVCRARAPFAELDESHAFGMLVGPDAAEPATYSWDASRLVQPQSVPMEAPIRVLVQPDVPAPEQIRDLPTVLLHAWLIPEEMALSGQGAKGVLRWLGTVWPANPDPFFVIGIRLRRMQYWSAAMYRLRAALLEPLFDPDVPFTPMAQFLLALALSQAEPEVTGLAVDVLIELIRDGRCVGPELGKVLLPLVTAGWLKLNRLAKQLETTARASHLHAHVCAQVVQTACSTLSNIPKDLHYLLSPLLEWLTTGSQGVRRAFRPILAKATTGKTGVLARRLLQLDFAPEGRHRFLVDALGGRLQRARRWAALSGLRAK
jgi:hypothetical protein